MSPERAAFVTMSDAEYEALTRRFWEQREPGCEVSLAVRRGGRVVRYVLIAPSGAVVTLSADAIESLLPSGSPT
jgi:hypothetical protein